MLNLLRLFQPQRRPLILLAMGTQFDLFSMAWQRNSGSKLVSEFLTDYGNGQVDALDAGRWYKAGCGCGIISPISLLLSSLMPSKSATVAKKLPMKTHSSKELAVKEVAAKLSARKAITGKHTTQGKRNAPSVIVDPASVVPASSAPSSVTTASSALSSAVQVSSALSSVYTDTGIFAIPHVAFLSNMFGR